MASDEHVRALLELQSTILRDVNGDGRLLVTNDASGSSQLVEVDTDGQLRRLTDYGEPVTGRYLPGERAVVLSVDPGGTERTQLWLLDPESPDVPAKPLVSDAAHIHTLLDVAPDAVLYTTNRRNDVDFDIVRRTVSTGAEQVLYDAGGSFGELVVSPDGSLIAATKSTTVAASSQLLLLDAGGNITELSDARTPGEWSAPRWLPDGRTLVVSTDSDAERFSVRAFDVDSRTSTVVFADDDADLTALPDPSGRRWLVIRSALGIDTLTVHDMDGLDSQRATPLTLPADGVVTNLALPHWSPDGEILAFTFSAPSTPPEAYSWSAATGVVRRTTTNAPDALPRLAPLALEWVPSFDGEQVPVFVVRGPKPDGSAVLYIHGGPEGVTVRSWNPVVAGLALGGHTVVLPNVRGSAGYGRRWVSLDDVEKRLDSVADLAAIHAWLPTAGADPSRAALFGGSYGGYMVLAGLTFQPELWAAGVDIVGISSLVTFLENTSAYRRVYREREYGFLDRHRAVLEEASPLRIIDRLRAPVFVIHGRNDPRVPLSEAEQVVAAARSNGVECELLVYDDEGHGLAKRANRLDAYPRAAQFLDRVLATG